MLRADIALLKLPGFLGRLLHCPPGPGGKPLFRPAGTAGAVGAQHDPPEHGLVDPVAQQDPGPQAVVLHHDAQQQMLRTDIAVAHLPGGQPGVLNSQFRPLGEFFIALHKASPLIRCIYNLYYPSFAPLKPLNFGAVLKNYRHLLPKISR